MRNPNIAAALVVSACGAGTGSPPDGRRAADGEVEAAVVPEDVRDDDVPYQLAASCDALVTWTLPDGLVELGRVAAVGPSEAWVIGNHSPVPEGGGALLHLAPDGTIDDTGWQGVHDVWTCGDDVWATGRGGLLLLRRAGGTDFRSIPTGATADLLSGFGCSNELWLAAGDHAVVRRGDESRTVGIEVEGFDPWALRVHGAGQARIATEYYGATLAYDREAGVFRLGGGTDDIVTDAFVKRDGTGITLHGGYGLRFDPAEPFLSETVPGLVANRVSRRADDDAWFVAGSVATHLTARGFEVVPLPGSYGTDVDSRATAVWAVGFDGAAVLTEAGFCAVVSVPPP